MSDNSDNESEASLPTFRPFTREELAIIENRILEKNLAAKKKAEKRAKNIAEFGDSARARKLYIDDESEEEEELEPNPKLGAGGEERLQIIRRRGKEPQFKISRLAMTSCFLVSCQSHGLQGKQGGATASSRPSPIPVALHCAGLPHQSEGIVHRAQSHHTKAEEE